MCTTHLGSPVVPEVELIRKTSSAPSCDSTPHSLGLRVGAKARRIHRQHRQLQPGSGDGSLRSIAALLVADQHLRLGTTQYRGYLADAGTGTDADDNSPTAFDRHEQHVDGARVPVPHPHPVAARHADAGQLLRQNVRRPIEFETS